MICWAMSGCVITPDPSCSNSVPRHESTTLDFVTTLRLSSPCRAMRYQQDLALVQIWRLGQHQWQHSQLMRQTGTWKTFSSRSLRLRCVDLGDNERVKQELAEGTRFIYGHASPMTLLSQAQLALIKKNQEKLLIAHERSKTITRSAEMKEIRERMQVFGSPFDVHYGCKYKHAATSHTFHCHQPARNAPMLCCIGPPLSVHQGLSAVLHQRCATCIMSADWSVRYGMWDRHSLVFHAATC